jgi:hypothetical protein
MMKRRWLIGAVAGWLNEKSFAVFVVKNKARILNRERKNYFNRSQRMRRYRVQKTKGQRRRRQAEKFR